MQEKRLYEYSVIRLVPKVEREEFINVGIILFSKEAKFIKVEYIVDQEKIKCFSKDNTFDIDCIINALEAFKKISIGESTGRGIAAMGIAERFRWLTSERSTMIQTSRPHPGFSSDLNQTFLKLFNELVL
ncbi:DUF3037 domain-containing protein [Apibacter mensalis]|uniref:DUF3037 domain-containing protein n=1 Tax=Apibacter mensalis TaxID=1586267 RepID=UPI0026F0F6C8|nr:DUF3037 domain-containing protein [Apibacter mensalis]